MIIEGNILKAARSEALELALQIVEQHLDDDASGRRLLKRLVAGSLRRGMVSVLLDEEQLQLVLLAQSRVSQPSNSWRR